FLYAYAHHTDLHSFPTRRSSDLRGTAPADRDEVDATPVDARQFGIGDHLGIEDQPEGIVAGDLMPELDEPHQFPGLIGAGQVGVDRKSTRLNSSHVAISYAVFCL